MKRKYFRKCGCCAQRNEQTFMHRVSSKYSSNGWLCEECFQDVEARNADYYFDEEF